jgi:hypothetical protein
MSPVNHRSEGMGSQGNGLIARRTWYRVDQLLKTHAPEEILVGVMWTGRDRFDFYFEEDIKFSENIDGWIENPTRVADDAPGSWVILNPHWKHEHNSPWYRHYYNEVASQIYTLEHIVNLQTWLDSKQVRYFFTTSFSSTFDPVLAQNPNCKWLYDQICWKNWLPVTSERDWVRDNCEEIGANNFHPTTHQHEKFVDQVIVPWLKDQNLLTLT